MANQWCRLWHDMPNDPKWRTVARAAGRPITEVLSVFLHLLVSASMNASRGVPNIDDEDIASALDMEVSAVAAIRTAMHDRVLDGERLSGWEKRQPMREDENSTGRVRRHREFKKNGMKRNETTDEMKKQMQMRKETTNAIAPRGATLPDWINEDAWKGFAEMRQKIRAPLTDRAIQGTIADLDKLRQQGQDPNAVLDQSTQRSWRGVFPIKPGYEPSPAANDPLSRMKFSNGRPQ